MVSVFAGATEEDQAEVDPKGFAAAPPPTDLMSPNGFTASEVDLLEVVVVAGAGAVVVVALVVVVGVADVVLLLSAAGVAQGEGFLFAVVAVAEDE